VPEVDYLIGDFVSTPASEARYFTERIINIDPCRLCYEPRAYAPDVSLLPFHRNGFITFGSFNRLSKLTAPVVGLWAEVMRAVPASRLLLKNAAFGDARMRQRLLTQFSEAGITSDRITLRPNSPHQEMLSEYGDMDIALDSFPYNGGLTTCESLWMGVPVVALHGDSMISRQSASLLTAANLAEWIASDKADFVNRAAEFSADVRKLATLRGEMRRRLLDSALLDAVGFTRKFETALHLMCEETSRRHRRA
jgi:predicted O-linked N-acetylglucosamine transferase (SPINDLY family)